MSARTSKKRQASRSVSLGFVAVLTLSGCLWSSGTDPNPAPDPSVPSVEPSGGLSAPPTDGETGETPEDLEDPSDDLADADEDGSEDAVDILDPPPNLQAERVLDFSALRNAWGEDSLPANALRDVEAYVQFQVADPVVLSGAWKDLKKSQYLAPLKGIFDPTLREQVASLNPKDPIDVHDLHSVAAFFSPNDYAQTPAGCDSQTTDVLEYCLAKDVIVSDVSISPSDLGGSTKLVEFTVKTTRLLDGNGNIATSTVRYKNRLWVDTEASERSIVGIQNQFRFGPVVTYAHD